jgi:hypothetical protein
MPKEGKNDRFARLVCEMLGPHLGEGCQYTGALEHGLRQATAFGHQTVSVHIWGANAPYRHLAFMLGVWHDRFEAVRLELNLEPTLKGAYHFWQTTGNLCVGWDAFKGQGGTWAANLNEDPAALIPEIVPFLSKAMPIFFGACADLRRVREMLLRGFNGPLFTSNPWQEIALIDAVLADWQHLAEFIQKKDLPFSGCKDMNLIQGIRNTCGFDFSE